VRTLRLATLCYGLDDQGSVVGRSMDFFFLFTTASRPALGLMQLPFQWVPQSLSWGLKRPGREADNSPPSSDEVKNAWRLKHRDKFTFTCKSSVVSVIIR
jgi:hypothetical protein